jgi:hypothetical protein
MTMNRIARLLAGSVLAVAIAPGVHAASTDDEATITVVQEGETPDDVVTVIELPEHAKADARTNGASDADTANKTKDNGSGRDLGQQASADEHGNSADKAHGGGDDNARNDARNDQRNDNAGGANRHGPH